MNFSNASFYKSFGLYKQLPPPERLEIAFSGRSNVGKSSLINKIMNRKNLARVSSAPGKTATINFYDADGIYLVDLPGYGYAKVAKSDKERWSELIGGYLNADRELALVFQLIDSRHPPTAQDMQMIDFYIETETPFALVFTKTDKLSKKEREERFAAFAEEIPEYGSIEKVEFSAVTGEGADRIRDIITELAGQA